MSSEFSKTVFVGAIRLYTRAFGNQHSTATYPRTISVYFDLWQTVFLLDMLEYLLNCSFI